MDQPTGVKADRDPQCGTSFTDTRDTDCLSGDTQAGFDVWEPGDPCTRDGEIYTHGPSDGARPHFHFLSRKVRGERVKGV